MWRKDELLLRFALMESIVQLPAILGFLRQFLKETELYIRTLKQHQSTLIAGVSLTGRLALENGIEGYQANARWARRAIAELEQKNRQKQ